MATLTFILGLCGAGKSTLANRIVAGRKFDEGFCLQPQQLLDLITELNRGNDCVVVEIAFCRAEKREVLVRELESKVPDVRINWLCFENDLAIANKNCRERTDKEGDPETLVGINRNLSRDYTYPDGAVVLKMWTRDM